MDIRTLFEYKNKGLLTTQKHPKYDLYIWNYTPKVQYEGLWDDITLICRGLVTDKDGVIISRGFPKFFNIEENRHRPTEDFEVFEKLDGQYIGVFWYEGEMIVNSRGSFTSPYAIEAKRILEEVYPEFSYYMTIGLTYCFELTGFEQIVVKYPKVDLIMTGIFEMTGRDYDLYLSDSVYLSGINRVERYSGLDYTKIKAMNWNNAEGVVVRFSNGNRCKIKFEEYVRLHRQMTNLSTTAIWEALKNGQPVSDILGDVPDEFYGKVKEVENKLLDEYLSIERLCRMALTRHYTDNRKLFAEKAKYFYNPPVLFAMYDDKDYSGIIWKIIKPKFEKI